MPRRPRSGVLQLVEGGTVNPDAAGSNPAPGANLPLGMNPPLALSEVVGLLKSNGRVTGFERLRDILLENWQALGHPLAVLKAILETDRHALFAQVAEQKSKGQFQDDIWVIYQKYLANEITLEQMEKLTKAAKGGGESTTNGR